MCEKGKGYMPFRNTQKGNLKTGCKIIRLNSARNKKIKLKLALALILSLLFIAVSPSESKKNYKISFNNGVSIEMVWIPGGTFVMGRGGSDEAWLKEKKLNDSDLYIGEKPLHSITLDGFWIGKYEITAEQYCLFLNEMGNPKSKWYDNIYNTYLYEYFNEESKFATIKRTKIIDKNTEDEKEIYVPQEGCAKRPANEIKWIGAIKFCQWLSEDTGKKYTLPTEAQWEYACRAGSNGMYCFGDDVGTLNQYAWYEENSDKQVHPVGEKRPNKWGLYDMYGNVEEWCLDYYDPEYYYRSPQKNPCRNIEPGEDSKSGMTSMKMGHRILRGGSYLQPAEGCRSANRDSQDPDSLCLMNNGFRIVCIPK